VFVKFTPSARQAIVLAQDEARALGHDWVGTEHLLIGLIREDAGIAARALRGLGLALEDVRARAVELVGRKEPASTGQIAFTPRSKKVLEHALSEARAMNHDFIGTEHVLLGLTREPDGLACRIAAALGADGERIRAEVLAWLSGGRGPEPA
jgi:ATP-dependent Clp protease ATP-binding subunit ClpC